MKSGPIIKTTEGYVQGTALTSVLGQKYLAFKGIPFAQPPVGPLRFKEPHPPSKWSGIRDASQDAGNVAIQQMSDTPIPHKIYGEEDCLYLNVYAKKIGSKRRPVMFFIHGGNFVEGTGNDCVYSQDYLITQDMVLVHVNYRLGPMGFLNLGHEVAPGNQGLRDIIAALTWVQRNIESFGGDASNVTIFGSSAGAIICHLFTLIPMAKGLFHKTILQSGTIFMIKDLFRKNDFMNGFRVASLLGFESDDPVQVIEFLRTVPATKLIEIEDRVISKRERIVLSNGSYEPVYDADYTSDPLIPLPIPELMKDAADVPMIIGHTTNESLLNFIGEYNEETYRYYDDNIDEIVENLLLCESARLPEIMRSVREFYLKNKPICKDTAWNLVNLVTDVMYHHFDRKLVDYRNERATAPTYVYNFSYMGNEPTIYQNDQGPQPFHGVAHADELSYLYYLSYIRESMEEIQFPREGTKDRLTVDRLVKMWYNFAATGDPTPAVDERCITAVWKPVQKHDLCYLDIGDELALRRDEDSESRSIYEKLRCYFFNF
ncbi:esterase FE4-like [Copidosoma floridanum]|uniref:esterase FE4-like n=1 Tax=Copidosoma floridanum TaxID=29053 RepID=UPI0006C9A784|nr:esterase FE4-like [Copidosoma floridanum]